MAFVLVKHFQSRCVENLKLCNNYCLEIKALGSDIRKWSLLTTNLVQKFQRLLDPSTVADSAIADVATVWEMHTSCLGISTFTIVLRSKDYHRMLMKHFYSFSFLVILMKLLFKCFPSSVNDWDSAHILSFLGP